MLRGLAGVNNASIAAYLATASLAAGTITTSQPMTLTQTWNAAGVTFTALKVNVTATASAAASLLQDWQIASASVASLDKGGHFLSGAPYAVATPAFAGTSGNLNTGIGFSGGSIFFSSNGVSAANISNAQGALQLSSTYSLGWGNGAADSVAPDVKLSRDAANVLALKNSNNDQTLRCYSTNAAYAQIQSLSENTTLSGATTDTAIQFPANCIPLGVTLNVTTLIAGATTFNVGDAASATRYGTGLAVAQGTTNAQAGTTNPVIPSAGTKVRFTAVGGAASFSAGVVRVTLHYISLSAPTS